MLRPAIANCAMASSDAAVPEFARDSSRQALDAELETFSVEQDVVATIAQPSRIVPVLSGFSEAPFVSRLERQLVSSCFGSALFRRNLELHSLPCLPAGTISDLRPYVLYALAAPSTPK